VVEPLAVGIAEADGELPQQVEPRLERQLLEVLGEELIEPHGGGISAGASSAPSLMRKPVAP